jgi:hypothetical protein
MRPEASQPHRPSSGGQETIRSELQTSLRQEQGDEYEGVDDGGNLTGLCLSARQNEEVVSAERCRAG